MIISFHIISSSSPHFYMAAGAIAQVSEVKREGVWASASLYYKTKVRLVSPSGPAHILIIEDKFPLGHENTTAKYDTLLFILITFIIKKR